MDKKLQVKRLNDVLGDNELREYLANKRETGSTDFGPQVTPDLRAYKKPYGQNISTLLIAPPITIPRDMQKRSIPPLGLSYIAAMLEANNLNVEMLDCTVEGYEFEQYRGNLMTYALPMDKIEVGSPGTELEFAL